MDDSQFLRPFRVEIWEVMNIRVRCLWIFHDVVDSAAFATTYDANVTHFSSAINNFRLTRRSWLFDLAGSSFSPGLHFIEMSTSCNKVWIKRIFSVICSAAIKRLRVTMNEGNDSNQGESLLSSSFHPIRSPSKTAWRAVTKKASESFLSIFSEFSV